MKNTIALPSYTGPLDLLLDLIKKNDINIYDIPISMIAEEFSDALHSMEDVGLDVLSEYMAYLADLLAIKAQMLVPADEHPLDEEQASITTDPREELVNQLLQYKVFKDLSTELHQMYCNTGISWFRDPDLSHLKQKPELDLNGITLQTLANVYNNLIQEADERGALVKEQFRYVKPESVTIEDMKQYVMSSVTEDVISLKKLMSAKSINGLLTREEKIASFLSILELSKEGRLVIGEEGEGNVWVRKK